MSNFDKENPRTPGEWVKVIATIGVLVAFVAFVGWMNGGHL